MKANQALAQIVILVITKYLFNGWNKSAYFYLFSKLEHCKLKNIGPPLNNSKLSMPSKYKQFPPLNYNNWVDFKKFNAPIKKNKEKKNPRKYNIIIVWNFHITMT